MKEAMFAVRLSASLALAMVLISDTSALITPQTQARQLLDEWRDYDQLRGGLDPDQLQSFFARRPNEIAGRLWEVARTVQRTMKEWEDGQPEEEVEFDFSASTLDQNGNEVWENNSNGNAQDRGVKLCDAVSSLGPVAVKVGQTLSQRADLIGDEACNALKRLQTANNPFDDKLAYAIIRESLHWPADAPLAPGMEDPPAGSSKQKPLFAWMSPKPVAVASLGQVYKATTHDGIHVAVKVQRPDAMALLAKDYACFKLALNGLEAGQKIIGTATLGDGEEMLTNIVDRVGADMMQELDYLKEAQNGKRFEESLQFLGFVKTPQVLHEYSSERVLVTKWVNGHHLSSLPREEGLQMTRMAVEACTASMVLTGFVHADPHEGNLMLDEDGNCVFLDFGLMSDVRQDVMEAFARGIQACLAEDWPALTQAFQDTGFIDYPIRYRDLAKGETVYTPIGFDPETGVDLGLAKLANELGNAMNEVEGGTSRFGALATVLNKELSPRWKMTTPPYVLLLCRTFLTLEGIAGRVDPNFNIYEMALPWAIRRSLSPSTKEGIKTLRNAILTEDDKIQWSQLMQMLEASESDNKSQQEMQQEIDDVSEFSSSSSSSTEAAKASAMNDAVVSLLGSSEGVVLRQVLKDLDSIDLLERLLSKDARPLRHKASLALSERKPKPTKKRASKAQASIDESVARPVSEACKKLRRRQNRMKQKVLLCIMAKHLRQILHAGPRAWAQSLYLAFRVTGGMVHQKLKRKLRLRKLTRRLLPV